MVLAPRKVMKTTGEMEEGTRDVQRLDHGSDCSDSNLRQG